MKDCIIHLLSDFSGPLINITDENFKKLKDYAERWVSQTFKEKERECAKNVLETSFEECTRQGNGYHRECYQKFCHSGYLRRLDLKVDTPAESVESTSQSVSEGTFK